MRTTTRPPTLAVVGLATVLVVLTGCSSPGADQAPAAGAGAAGTAAATSTDPLPANLVATAGGRGPLLHVAVQGGRTTVRGFDRTTKAPLGTGTLDGAWELPVVVPGTAPDGVTAGGAVVLAGEAAAGRSRFAVLRAPFTDPPTIVDLPGAFEYDAMSPDAGRLYLVEHLPPKGSQHYQVRWYDLAAGRLDPQVVVDKANIDEWMAGRPVSRVSSVDGSVVATMYERSGGEPFVHVLRTTDVFAQCIDLPESLAGKGFTLGGTVEQGLVVNDAGGTARYRIDLDAGTVTPVT